MKLRDILVEAMYPSLMRNKKSIHPQTYKAAFDKADDVLAALSHAGYAIVPVEPTEAMIHDGMKVEGDWCTSAAESMGLIYRAMIAAGETPAFIPLQQVQ